jgi:phosphate transport system permease protein
MTTDAQLKAATAVLSSREAKFRQRKRVNRVALALSLLAMCFGLFWLIWILWETVRLGIGGLTLATVT